MAGGDGRRSLIRERFLVIRYRRTVVAPRLRCQASCCPTRGEKSDVVRQQQEVE